MAYLTVTTQLDVVAPGDGQLSLREAIEMANATSEPDTIRFVATLAGQRLVLTGGQLAISQDVTITGDSGNNGDHVTIDAGGRSRVLSIGGWGVDADLQELVITGGNNSGIYLGQGSRLAWPSPRSAELASYRAAVIFVAQGSRLSIADSTISQDSTYGEGACSCSPGSEVRVVRSKLSENLAIGFTPASAARSLSPAAGPARRGEHYRRNDAFSGGGIFTRAARSDHRQPTPRRQPDCGRYSYGLGAASPPDQGRRVPNGTTITGDPKSGGSRRLRAWGWRDAMFRRIAGLSWPTASSPEISRMVVSAMTLPASSP